MKKVIIEKDTRISKTMALSKGDMLIETKLGWLLVEAEDEGSEEDKEEDDKEMNEEEDDDKEDKESDKKEESKKGKK